MVDNSIFPTDSELCNINTEELILNTELFANDFSGLGSVSVPVLPEHWEKYPNMENVDTEHALDIHIEPVDNQNWLYNNKMNKVFIKLNSVMTVTVSYKPITAANLSLRAMIVFASPDDMHLHVKRCANHKTGSKHLDKNQDVPADHILKCYHPHAEYVGKESGQLFGERLSILVPLGRSAINEDGIANEIIKWEFLCQNSCATGINRKSTAVIFTLENELYEIIGKKVMPFKVCSCPRRDMQREDPTTITRKREATEPPQGKRPSKILYTSQPFPTEIKTEPPTPSPTPSPVTTSPGLPGHTVTLTMPTAESMKHVLRCAINEVAGSMARDRTVPPENYKVYADKIQGLLNSL